MTPALDALLKEVEARADADVSTNYGRSIMDILMSRSETAVKYAPRLAAMLRVAVEALDNAHGNIGKVYTYPAIALSIEGVTRHALARIEAMAKGEA